MVFILLMIMTKTWKLIRIHIYVVIDNEYFYMRLYFVYTFKWWRPSLKYYSKHSVDNEWWIWRVFYMQCENEDGFFLGEHVIDDDEFEDVLYKLNQSFKCWPNVMY